MRALICTAVVATLVVVAASAGWRSARRPIPPHATAAPLHELLENQQRAVAEREARRLAQADFERSLPSRVTLLRRELTEPGLRVSRVASVDQTAKATLFSINGEVRSQGSYAFSDGMTFRDAIQKAGGLTDRADASHIGISRATDGKTRRLAVELDDLVRQDDVIHVPKRAY